MTKWFFLFLLPMGSLLSIDVPIQAKAAILMNAKSGAILFEKNARVKRHPASITKIATVLYALKNRGQDLDAVVEAVQDDIGWVSAAAKKKSNYTLPAHWLEVGATHVGIKRGERLSLRSLLYGTMLPSGDDSSNMIARHVGGSIPKFMDELNEYMRQLGLKDTHFVNPHGLHHPKHQTTAFDMALLTCEALRNPMFRKIVQTVRYKRPKTNIQEAATWVTSNRLIKKSSTYYPKAIGVKTGYISAAQNTLVAAAEDGDRCLIAVLLGCSARNDTFKNAISLFEAAFQEELSDYILVPSGVQPYTFTLEGVPNPISTYIERGVKVSYYPSEAPKLIAHLVWDELISPIRRSDRVGEIQISSEEDGTLATIPLLAGKDAYSSWFYDLFGFYLPPFFSYGAIAFLFFGAGSLFVFVRRV